MIKVCETCKIKFKGKPRRKFCSRKCYGIWLSKHQTGNGNHQFGIKKTEEQRKEQSIRNSGSNNPNYKKPMSDKQKEEISKTLKTFYENKENHPWFGKTLNPEHRRKIRIAKIKERKEKDINGFKPNYNNKACEYFKRYDALKNTKGFYGKKEYLVENLGYFLDYINFDTKLIIEWDEEHHYKNNKLKEKDITRQKEIQEHFPDFNFIRIREKLYSF